MKRLPVYVMTAAIAMAGAATMTSQASVQAIVIGGNGNNCNTSWKQFTGNFFNGIKLPNCDNLNLNECGLPDIGMIPDQSQPSYTDPDGSGMPDIGVPNQPSEDEINGSFASQVAALVNEERAKAGLYPLSVDSSVSMAASTRAIEIERSFSHTRPDGSGFSTALTQNGVSFQGAGENIAYGQSTPQEVMNSWMNSQGHRANILSNDFTTIGVGYYQNSAGTGYWAQLFTQ